MSIRSKARLGFVAAVVGACLLVAVPALGVNRDGVWKGLTSQDRTMRFEVEGDTITAEVLGLPRGLQPGGAREAAEHVVRDR